MLKGVSSMTKSLRVIALIAVVALVAIIAGCGNSSNGNASDPEKTVTEFMTAFVRKDTNQVIALLDPDTLNTWEQQAQAAGMSLQTLIESGMASLVPAGSTDAQLRNPQFETTSSGDTANVQVVTVELTYNDEQGKAQTKQLSGPSTLSKKNGKWYVTSIQVM